MPNTPHSNVSLSRLQRQASRAGAASLLMLGATGLAMGMALRGAGHHGFSAISFAGVALFVFAVALSLFARSLPEHLPHERIGPANAVTLVRLALAALLAALLVGVGGSTGHELLAWPIVTLATVAIGLDGLDGWIARRGGWSSRFGARFDMETDAFLIALLCLLAWQFEKAGVWVLLSGGMRYLFVLAGHHYRWLRADLPPSWRRKAVCVLQSVTLLLALLPPIERPVSAAIALAGLVALLISFAIDIVWLFRHRDQQDARAF